MNTPLDRILMEAATLHVVYVNTPPQRPIPSGIKTLPGIHRNGMIDYSHRLVAGNDSDYFALIATLQAEKKLYDVSIETKPGWEWAVKPGSRTYEAIWSLLGASSIAAGLVGVFSFLAL